MKTLWIITVIFLAQCYCAAEILPLCPGESLIPRGDKNTWKVKAENGTKARKAYAPGSMYFYFPGGKEKAKAAISRDYNDLPVGDFDQLVCYCHKYGRTGPGISVVLKVVTDKGTLTAKSREIAGDFSGSMTDLVVDLNGAKTIKNVSLECTFSTKSGVGNILLVRQLILRNKNEFASYLKYWKRFDNLKWEGLIKDESYNPTYKLRYGLLFSQQDLDRWREKYLQGLSKGSFSPPEKAITRNIGRQRGFEVERIRLSGTKLFRTPGIVAFRAVLFRDRKLMRLAARYLLSLCAVENWSDTTCPQPVGHGAISAFNNGAIGVEAACALDCVGEMLTVKGYNYVLKTLMYKVFMPVTYSEWSRPSAFYINQGVSFIQGKLIALLIAERHWDRVNPYTDLAKAELDETVSFLFKKDGSYMEASAAYLRYTIACMVRPYQAFASMRKKPLSEVIPVNVSKSGNFAQVISSSCKNPHRAIVPIGESTDSFNFPAQLVGFMAIACPQSAWLNLFNKLTDEEINKYKKDMYKSIGVTFTGQCEKLKDLKDVQPRSLIVLKECGLASSWRESSDRTTKIVVIGDAVDTGKKHHDVGSFILEYAGDIYAMDLPVKSGIFSHAAYHNMLVAIDEKGELTNSIAYTDRSIYHDAKARNSMRPEATGSGVEFHAKVNASKSWDRKYLRKWVRTLESQRPDELTIRDEYRLGREASGAAFVWNTYLPCKVEENRITINGEYGSKCVIAVPEGCTITLDKFSPGSSALKGMTLPLNHECTRIIIRKSGKVNQKGTLITKIRLNTGSQK